MEAAMSDEPENFTLALLRKIDGKVDGLREAMATKSDVADVGSEVHSLRADVGSDIMNLEKQIKAQEKRLSDQISGLRRSVMEYHSSQIGHGVLLTEFEERLRLEEHVGLTPEGH
jgi:DNA-binding FrmR family transcriptional regulator